MDPARHDEYGTPPAGQPLHQAHPQQDDPPGPPGYVAPYQNPYAGPNPSTDQHPYTDPTPYAGAPTAGNPYQQPPKTARQRFSPAAVTGIVIATLGWLLALLPLTLWIRTLGSSGSGLGGVVDLIGILGVIALVGSVAGFIAALKTGNRKLAARLYIIPSLVWQLSMVALILWLFSLLLNYNG